MNALRGALLLAMVSFLLVSWRSDLSAANITTSWERPVVFKIVDADSGAALSQPIVIIKQAKLFEGSVEPIHFYDVITGSAAGLAEYQVEVKSDGAEVRVIVPGYLLLTRKVSWKELPPRELDSFGLEKNLPRLTLTLKPLPKASDWKREFRLVVAPELEDILQLKPPYLSKEGQRVINEFLNRERHPPLGF